MTFTLLIMGVYGALPVGTFATMDECKRAAAAAEIIGPPRTKAPLHLYICVQSK